MSERTEEKNAAAPEPDMTRAYYEANARSYAARTRRRLDRDALREFMSRLPPAARVLDAGCGSGRDLKTFVESGLVASGLDSSRPLCEIARSHSGAPVECAELAFYSPPRGSLDGIWCHRVLLHLPPPAVQRVCGIFFAALKPGGILFASIDEGEGFESDRTDDPTGPARRIHYYPPNEFASLIRQSGFQILAQGRNLEASRQVAFLARRIGS